MAVGMAKQTPKQTQSDYICELVPLEPGALIESDGRNALHEIPKEFAADSIGWPP